VLVFALYVSSYAVTRLYTHPERVWALVSDVETADANLTYTIVTPRAQIALKELGLELNPGHRLAAKHRADLERLRAALAR
jgi:hypothetical protein